MRIILMLVAFLFNATATFAGQTNANGEEPAGSLRIPNSIEQGKVDRPLREKYKAEFASRDPADRGTLGRKLREAADAENDPIAKFVYLREARDLSVDAGDFSYSIDVIDDMARSYPIDAEEMKATALAAGVDRARLAPADLAHSYLKVSDEMLAIWNADLASKAAYLAMKEAAHDPELLEEAKKRDKLAKLQRHEILQAMQAQQKLARNPDDPQQNLILGRHLCFNTQHWEAGLRYLAKSSSTLLKELAQKELENPSDAATMAALADGWWNFSDAKAALPAGAARRRAAFWYEKALPQLTGEKKERAEKRVADAKAIP